MFNNISSNFNLQNLQNQSLQNANQNHANFNAKRNRKNQQQDLSLALPNNPHQALQMMFMTFMQQMMAMMSQFTGNYGQPPVYQPPTQPPVYQPPTPPVYQPPTPPVYEPPKPPVYEPPTPPVYEPPVYEDPKVLGSAGLFGDPQFGVFTPNLGNAANPLKAFESNIKNNEVATLLNDPDNSGLKVDVKGIQVDPNNAASTGVGEVRVNSGSDAILIKNNGDLLINNVVKGNIKTTGFIAPITLASGAVISTANEIDGAGGVRAERFVISNGDYKITAALRSPHADSNNFFDMNFEELKTNAADNASGYRTSVPGLTNQFGIVDLLKLEPGNLGSIA